MYNLFQGTKILDPWSSLTFLTLKCSLKKGLEEEYKVQYGIIIYIQDGQHRLLKQRQLCSFNRDLNHKKTPKKYKEVSYIKTHELPECHRRCKVLIQHIKGFFSKVTLNDIFKFFSWKKRSCVSVVFIILIKHINCTVRRAAYRWDAIFHHII